MSTEKLNPSALKVLVLDDDDFALELIVGMLEQRGVSNITAAVNGKEGLLALEKMTTAPDYIICDILMPDMDGMDFLVKLAAAKYQGKVILLSGIDQQILNIAENVVKEDGIELVATFIKPVKQEQLDKVMGLVA